MNHDQIQVADDSKLLDRKKLILTRLGQLQEQVSDLEDELSLIHAEEADRLKERREEGEDI